MSDNDNEFVVDVKSNIENKIKEFIDNNSGSLSGHQLCFSPLTFRELEDFMLLMRYRYSQKVVIHWFYDIQNFRVQFILERPL